jgi:serine/threonine protein kinase
VEQIADQLLLGLAALHNHKLFHGDLRRSNIFFSEAPNANNFVGHTWIADTVLGALTHWSHGQFRPALSPMYFPPEFRGQPQEPSAKADLYSLGVLVSELLLGTKAIEEAHQAAVDANSSLWKSLSPRLKSLRVGRRLRYLLGTLVADQDERPADGTEAIKLLRRWRTKSVWMWCTMFAIVGILFGGSGIRAITFSAGEVAQREANARALLEKKVAEQAAGLENKQAEIERLKEQLARIERHDPPPASEKPAAAWQAILRPDRDATPQRDRHFEQEEKALRAKHEELINTDPKQAKVFGDWLKNYRDLRVGRRAHEWFETDEEMKRLFANATREPWERATWKLAEQHLTDLGEAAKSWQKCADVPNPTEEGLIQRIAICREPVKEILRKWLDDFKGHANWTLRVVSDRAPEGNGTWRTVSVLGSGKTEPMNRAWPDAGSHSYIDKPRDASFEWKIGEPIIVTLKCDRSIWLVGYRPCRLYDDSFTGPLAAWKLNQKGKSEQDGFVLEYEVLNCPGPPAKWFRTVPTDAANILGGK